MVVPFYNTPNVENLTPIVEMYKKFAIKQNLDIIIVLNPHNGPGEEYTTLYDNGSRLLKDTGLYPIGYVYTAYGNRPLSDVFNDIDKWISWYPSITGIFLDEVSGNVDKYEYYNNIRNYIKRKFKQEQIGIIVGNGGTDIEIDSCFDIMCIYEHYELPNIDEFKNKYLFKNRSKLCVLLYNQNQINSEVLINNYDGSNITNQTFNLQKSRIVKKTACITYIKDGQTKNISDNYLGNIEDDIVQCVIDYDNGTLTLTLKDSVDLGSNISIEYKYADFESIQDTVTNILPYAKYVYVSHEIPDTTWWELTYYYEDLLNLFVS
jgi:hypothetical protein